MYTLGIDIGSSSSKAVLLKNGSEIIAEDAIQAGTGSSGPSRVLQQIMQQSGLELNEIDYTIATGYGRFSVAFANEQISEITCHAKGIAWLLPGTGTIIDIGGQDAKAISLDSNGNILKFFMNDKCAAGTGRFLDVMSRVLETELSEMGEWHFRSAHPAKVSSTCTVFAESEVISLLSQGIAKEDIIQRRYYRRHSCLSCSQSLCIGLQDRRPRKRRHVRRCCPKCRCCRCHIQRT